METTSHEQTGGCEPQQGAGPKSRELVAARSFRSDSDSKVTKS